MERHHADDKARREHLDMQRKAMPDEPGVYLYHDAAGTVLYVGKAKRLRSRVNSYFTQALDARRHALVMRIADIEVFSVSSEREALMFEQQLINRHKPPFNVMLRDDKSYPFIAVTLGDDYPRVMFSREKKRSSTTRYFGPYSSAKRVRESLDLPNRIFPFRPCEGSEPGRQSGIPCLDYHIERCAAPCVGYISKEDYGKVIEDVIQVLKGSPAEIEQRLTAQMKTAAQDLEFEQAARLRNRISDLAKVKELQRAESPGAGSFDVLGVSVGDELANAQVLQVRDGRLHDRRSTFLEQINGLPAGDVLVQFALGYYEPGRPIPAQIVVEHNLLNEEQSEILQGELSRVRGAGVEVRSAQRGEKRRLSELAMRNAEQALTYDSIRERTTIERRAMALEQLRDQLDLENLPMRIECYDISNLQDQAPVASMVVLEDGRPHKAHYRKFAMRHDEGQNDFAMMAEVISRRFTRLNNPDEEDPSFSAIPDLVIIDGGPGQLGAALNAIRAVGIERVPLVSLAKQEELVFLPGRKDPVVLERHSPSLHLIQRIRDEAHRFALGYHRKRRSAEMREGRGSILDELEGVGDARRRALLTFFGSPERVIKATLEELEAVPGLPGKVARRIHNQLHRFGGGEIMPKNPRREE